MEVEVKVADMEINWNILIGIGILGLFIALGLAIVEVYQAKSFCDGQEGDYSFNFKEVKHYCSGDEISRYQGGWEFDKFKVDFSKVKVELP